MGEGSRCEGSEKKVKTKITLCRAAHPGGGENQVGGVGGGGRSENDSVESNHNGEVQVGEGGRRDIKTGRGSETLHGQQSSVQEEEMSHHERK